MARIRTVKPDFFLDSKLAKKHPLVRLFFQGLWCLADREGRLEEDLDKIKIQIIPYDKMTAEKCLSDLHPEFINRYEVGQKRYIQVKNFKKHQHPHPKEPESQFPSPSSSKAVERNGEPWKETASQETNSKLREGKGREGVSENSKQLGFAPEVAARNRSEIGSLVKGVIKTDV